MTFIKKSVQSVQSVQTHWYDSDREFGQKYFKVSKMSKVSTKFMSVWYKEFKQQKKDQMNDLF